MHLTIGGESMTLGDIIKEYRTSHGLSQDAIAERSGLSKAYISILERNRNPKTGEVVVIPKRLSVKFSVGKYLFEDLNK